MSIGNLLAGQHDTQKERPPPSKPIPVSFPALNPPEPSTTTLPALWGAERTSGISKHFLSLKKPSDVTEQSLAHLNVTFQPECDFETLLSSLSNNAQSHLPPKSWLQSPDQEQPPDPETETPSLSNGRKAPTRAEFLARARELFFNNKDAFSTLTRKGPEGQAPLRLAHFRKFWEGLDNLAYYWDNSLDEYRQADPEAAGDGCETTPSVEIGAGSKAEETRGETKTDWIAKMGSSLGSPSEEEPRKKAKTEAVSDHTTATPIHSNGFGAGSIAAQTTSINPSRVLPARIAPHKTPWATGAEPRQKPTDVSQGSYRGYRIGNGAEMPDQYRVDCVRAFVEPIAWAFGVTFLQHRRPPVLTMENVRFPVRMTSVSWRGPRDRVRARQGWMEGPVLGIQCRPDVNFGSTGNLDAESYLDAVRELGGLLLLAQERHREGKTEKQAGLGKWWTTKERWGGGPGGEVESSENDTNPETKAQEKLAGRNPDGSKVRRRPTPAQVWKILRPGNPLWDPKVVYQAIGKDKSVEWDDVGLRITCSDQLQRANTTTGFHGFVTEPSR